MKVAFFLQECPFLPVRHLEMSFRLDYSFVPVSLLKDASPWMKGSLRLRRGISLTR